MINLNKLSQMEFKEVQVACAYLFSPDQAKDNEFKINLDLESIEDAFAQKEKRYNPDFHPDEAEEMLKKRKERYIKVNESYEILKKFVGTGDREKSFSETNECKGKIIAIGGAKGGIGKSIFSTNLGVFLSLKGHKTVMVDLDLGGANLHYYLGQNSLKYSINDYLDKKVQTLNEIITPTEYGPDLIGGGSSQLGSANIHFAKKIKLLKAIKALDAEYIVIDLGGETSYNIIDFFLSAETGIVLTTCEPAAYVSAYNFIKVALQRKLNRIFGPESEYSKQKDDDLKRLIDESIFPSGDNRGNFLVNLFERVKKEQPQHLSFIKKVVGSFKPKLVINMILEESNLGAVVDRIQQVARKMLSVQIEYLGCIPFESRVKTSATELVPAVSKHSEGTLSDSLRTIYNNLE